MWLWPKSGGEERLIPPGMLINYHIDCLLIFSWSLRYLRKLTRFIQTPHRTAEQKQTENPRGSGVHLCRGAGTGRIHPLGAEFQRPEPRLTPAHTAYVSQEWSPSEANRVLLIKAAKFPRSPLWHCSFLKLSYPAQDNRLNSQRSYLTGHFLIIGLITATE